MKMLVLAMLLAVMQAAPIVPRPAAPKNAEANRTPNTQIPKTAQNDQTQPAQPTPAASSQTQPPGGTGSQPMAKTGNDNAQQRANDRSDEGSDTQHKITIFTGILAGVGVLQFVVMFLTWLVYLRQAREMRGQREEMRRQRKVMLDQWKAIQEQGVSMKGQIDQMKAAGAQTSEQIGVMRGQLKATEDLVEAYRDGLIQNRQRDRARVMINLDPINPMPAVNIGVTCRLENGGQSRAFILNSLGKFLYSDTLTIEVGNPPNWSLFFGEYLDPGQEIRQIPLIPLGPDSQLTQDEIIEMRGGEDFALLWVCPVLGRVRPNLAKKHS